MHFFHQDFTNLYCNRNEQIFIIPKKYIEKELKLAPKTKLTLSEVVTVAVAKRIKECKIPIGAEIKEEIEKTKSKEPSTKYEGLIEHIYQSKDGYEYVYLRSNQGIHCIKNNGHLLELKPMCFVKLFNLKTYKDGDNVYIRTYENSFMQVIKKFALRSVRISKQWREGLVNSCHFVEGYLLSCVYFSNTNTFQDNNGNDIKLLWGVFSIHIKGEKNTTNISFAHEAFEYFNSIHFADELTWKTGKVEINKFLSEPAHIAQKVRILIKIYKSKGVK